MNITSDWSVTKYHEPEPTICPFNNGCYYEIGFYSEWSKTFVHQGVRLYNNGFKDDDNYCLKPVPTHFKKIELTEPKFK